MNKKILLGILTIICILIKPCIEEIFIQSSNDRNSMLYSFGYCDSEQCTSIKCVNSYRYEPYLESWHKKIATGSICKKETSIIESHSTIKCCDIGIKCTICGYIDHSICHNHSQTSSCFPNDGNTHTRYLGCALTVRSYTYTDYNTDPPTLMTGHVGVHSFPASQEAFHKITVTTAYGTFYACPTCNSYYCSSGSYTESHSWDGEAPPRRCVICGYMENIHAHSYRYAQANSTFHNKYCSSCSYSVNENHTMIYCCKNGNRCQNCGYANHVCHICVLIECPKPHCTVEYCSTCTSHTCAGDHTYITCGLYHCKAYYCTKCGHSCGGGHTNIICNLAHCGQNYCTKCGHSCGGGHTNTICNLAHCGQSYCTKCGHSCGGDHVSGNVWVDAGNQHIVYCQYCTNKIYASHAATDWSLWTDYTEAQHRRICNICNASSYGNKIYETENHIYNKNYVPLAQENVNYLTHHNATCYADNCGRGALQEHEDINNDYICDKCNIELWRVTYTPEALTNSDVTATLKLWKPGQCSNPDINRTDDTFTHAFIENGEYDFVLQPDKTITAKVDWISKKIKGRIVYTPISLTTGDVTASFVPNYESLYDKGKRITIESITTGGETTHIDDEIAENGKYDYIFTKNGAVIFNLKDNIGNIESVTATVNWIIGSNKATISNTYHVMKGGFVFTNILVKADESWSLQDLSDSIEFKINKKGSVVEIPGAVKDIVKINDYYYTKEYEDFTGDTVFEKGIYYIKIGIGGSNLFNDVEAVYEIEIKGIKGSETIYFPGRNKMEVKPYDLPDLT